MAHSDFAELGRQHTLGDVQVPRIALEFAQDRAPELVWRNDLGGLTFQLGDRYLKWNPPSTGIDLERERTRLEWISARHPAPRVLDHGIDGDAQRLLTEAIPGGPAVGDVWRVRRPEAIAAIAVGLRALHAIPIGDFPADWTAQAWAGKEPPSIGPRPHLDPAVLVHGDACAPNTLISDTGDWTGHVDFGDLAIDDRWADLAIAALSLDWNYGRDTSRNCMTPTASRQTRSASATTAHSGTCGPDLAQRALGATKRSGGDGGESNSPSRTFSRRPLRVCPMICRRTRNPTSAPCGGLQSRPLSGLTPGYVTLTGSASSLIDASTAHEDEAASTLTLLPKQRRREQADDCQLLRFVA